MTSFAQIDRSEDWQRLSGSGYFKITDHGTSITISASRSPLRRQLWLMASWGVLIGFAGFMVGGSMLGLAMGFGLGLAAVFRFLFPALSVAKYAFTVVYLPDRVEFFGPFGGRKGTLSRGGLQQISLEPPDAYKFASHRFISDVGMISAFPERDRDHALLRNNILMVAYSQPLKVHRVSEFLR